MQMPRQRRLKYQRPKFSLPRPGGNCSHFQYSVLLNWETSKQFMGKGQIKSKSRLASLRFSLDLISFPWRAKKQTKQIGPFVFWEKLAEHKLLSRLTDLNNYYKEFLCNNIIDYFAGKTHLFNTRSCLSSNGQMRKSKLLLRLYMEKYYRSKEL